MLKGNLVHHQATLHRHIDSDNQFSIAGALGIFMSRGGNSRHRVHKENVLTDIDLS